MDTRGSAVRHKLTDRFCLYGIKLIMNGSKYDIIHQN